MMTDSEETRQTGHPKNTWLDCVKKDMKNFELLTQKYAQVKDQSKLRIRGNWNQGAGGNWLNLVYLENDR